MSEPYLMISYWKQDAPVYDNLIRQIIRSLSRFDAHVTLWSAAGMSDFETVDEARDYLEKTDEPTLAFQIVTVAGPSIATSQWGRTDHSIELDIRASDQLDTPASDAEPDAFEVLKSVVSAIIEMAKADFSWITRIPGDIDGVSSAATRLEEVVLQTPARTIELDTMAHAGWLFAWPLRRPPVLVNTAEKVAQSQSVAFVDIVACRPIDLCSGWVGAIPAQR